MKRSISGIRYYALSGLILLYGMLIYSALSGLKTMKTLAPLFMFFERIHFPETHPNPFQ